MGAFDTSSLNSLWGYLFGIIFLVFASLGLTLLGDGLINLNSNGSEIKELNMRLIDGQNRIAELSKKVDILHEQFQKKQIEDQNRTASGKLLVDLKKQLSDGSDETTRLKKSITSEKAAIAALTEQFNKFRRASRALLWASGRGRGLNKVPHPKGGFYENPTISTIDAQGFLIRHRTGTARLPLHQIPAALLEEFDLHP